MASSPETHELSQLIVLNEWIFHDLGGGNGRNSQIESFEFLEALIQKPDRIAVLIGSPWITKAYRLMKHHDPLVLAMGKTLNQSVLLDQNKCLQLTPHDLVVLPVELQEIDLKNDKYLFDVFYSANAELIVTSDRRLIEKVTGVESVHLVLRENFLENYLA